MFYKKGGGRNLPELTEIHPCQNFCDGASF